MPVRISRVASHCAIPLSPMRIADADQPELKGATATGFFWFRNDKWYLVTNLHVVTGWNYEVKKSLSSTGLTPTHLDFSFSVDCSSPDDPTELMMLKRVGKRVNLYQDDQPNWLVHPTHKTNVDVAVVKLFVSPDAVEIRSHFGARDIITKPINKLDFDESYQPKVSDDSFVIGFPKAMHAMGFPIWKRASIASEPDIDLDGLPKLLIDTATRQGMSGSPVFARSFGVFSPGSVLSKDSFIGEATNFLGVYSGRIGEDELGVQLGIVWKSTVIDEIIDGDTRGSIPWEAAR